jgi:hypothetical protein
MMGICQQCGRYAQLHFCSGCGKWICSAAVCNLKSGLETLANGLRRIGSGISRRTL